MDKIFWIITQRYHYTAQTSLGKMFFEYDKEYVTNPPKPVREYFGATLEDTVRPANIKVYEHTGLPDGLVCNVSLYEDSHYKKTIIFHTEKDKLTILVGILKWVGCLVHGGQTHKDTAGCVIVAENIIDMDTIQGSLKDKLRLRVEEMISKGYIIKARFENLSQII